MAEINPKDIQDAISKTQEITKIKLEQERLFQQMSLVIYVLLIGAFLMAFALGTMLVEAFRSKEESYTELVKTVQEQNYQIEAITNGLQKYKIIP